MTVNMPHISFLQETHDEVIYASGLPAFEALYDNEYNLISPYTYEETSHFKGLFSLASILFKKNECYDLLKEKTDAYHERYDYRVNQNPRIIWLLACTVAASEVSLELDGSKTIGAIPEEVMVTWPGSKADIVAPLLSVYKNYGLLNTSSSTRTVEYDKTSNKDKYRLADPIGGKPIVRRRNVFDELSSFIFPARPTWADAREQIPIK